MVNNSTTNINKIHPSIQLREVIVVDIGGIVDNHSMSYGER
jgi:hypothetical protein